MMRQRKRERSELFQTEGQEVGKLPTVDFEFGEWSGFLRLGAASLLKPLASVAFALKLDLASARCFLRFLLTEAALGKCSFYVEHQNHKSALAKYSFLVNILMVICQRQDADGVVSNRNIKLIWDQGCLWNCLVKNDFMKNCPSRVLKSMNFIFIEIG